MFSRYRFQSIVRCFCLRMTSSRSSIAWDSFRPAINSPCSSLHSNISQESSANKIVLFKQILSQTKSINSLTKAEHVAQQLCHTQLTSQLDFMKQMHEDSSLPKRLLFEFFNVIRILLQNDQLRSLAPNQTLQLLQLYCTLSQKMSNSSSLDKNDSRDLFHIKEHIQNIDFAQYSLDDLQQLLHCCFRLKLSFDAIHLNNQLSPFLQSNKNLSTELLFSMSKLCRLSDCNCPPLTTRLQELVENSAHTMQFSRLAAFLGYFANSALYFPKAFASAERCAHQHLQQSLQIEDMNQLRKHTRSKDIAKLLWSFAFVNHRLNDSYHFFQQVEFVMFKKLESDFLDYPHHLLDCIKSMILLGHLPLEIVSQAFLNAEFVHQLACSPRFKTRSDLYFILNSLQIEHSAQWFERFPLLAQLSKPLNQRLSVELNKRPLYQKLKEYLIQKLNEDPQNLQYVYPLSHINISSLRIKSNNRTTFYELLDESNCLHVPKASRSNGLVTTKLRQMRKLGNQVVVIDSRSFFESKH